MPTTDCEAYADAYLRLALNFATSAAGGREGRLPAYCVVRYYDIPPYLNIRMRHQLSDDACILHDTSDYCWTREDGIVYSRKEND